MFKKLKSYLNEMSNHESILTSTVYYLTNVIRIMTFYLFTKEQGNIRQIVIESGNLIKTITYKNLPGFSLKIYVTNKNVPWFSVFSLLELFYLLDMVSNNLFTIHKQYMILRYLLKYYIFGKWTNLMLWKDIRAFCNIFRK